MARRGSRVKAPAEGSGGLRRAIRQLGLGLLTPHSPRSHGGAERSPYELLCGISKSNARLPAEGYFDFFHIGPIAEYRLDGLHGLLELVFHFNGPLFAKAHAHAAAALRCEFLARRIE